VTRHIAVGSGGIIICPSHGEFLRIRGVPVCYSEGCSLRNRLIEIRPALLGPISHGISEIRAGAVGARKFWGGSVHSLEVSDDEVL